MRPVFPLILIHGNRLHHRAQRAQRPPASCKPCRQAPLDCSPNAARGFDPCKRFRSPRPLMRPLMRGFRVCATMNRAGPNSSSGRQSLICWKAARYTFSMLSVTASPHGSMITTSGYVAPRCARVVRPKLRNMESKPGIFGIQNIIFNFPRGFESLSPPP